MYVGTASASMRVVSRASQCAARLQVGSSLSLRRSLSTSRSNGSTSTSRRFLLLTGGTIAGLAVLQGFYSLGVAHAQADIACWSDTGTTPAHPSTCSLRDMPQAKYDATEANIAAAQQELAQLLGPSRVSDDLGLRISRSSTAWSAAPRGEIDRFALVVSPQSTEEVSAIAKICHRRRIPMTAYSGGTSLEGSLAATQGGVCIDFKLMNKILELRKDDLDVTVQPAVGYQELNEKIAADSLFFPPDPAPGAQIGGMVSQGCSGPNAYRYGTMKDLVLGLTLVLADGTIVKTRGRPRKSNCGYDLTRLIVGSEGTLALVTEAHLKLTSKPVNEKVAVAAFPSMQDAVSTVVKIVQNDMPLHAMEVLCETSMRGVNEGGHCDKTYDEVPTLFFKFAGKDQAAVDQQIKQVQAFAKEAACKSFEFSTNEEEAEALWAARKTVLWSVMGLKNEEDKFLSADSAVPISKLAKAIQCVKAKVDASGFTGFFVAHAGDGNFHTGIFYPADQQKKARELITWIQREAIKMDGTVTGEHGCWL